jgi:transcriptional regulator with GAF, ATPase, and Fis domain
MTLPPAAISLPGVTTLLDRLPIAICRWDLASPLRSTLPAEAICQGFTQGGRVAYTNLAYRRLRESAAAATQRDLQALEPGGCRGNPALLAQFLAEGMQLSNIPVRLPGPDRAPRYLAGTWLGHLEGRDLAGIWIFLEDLTAQRSMERAVTEDQTPELVGDSPPMHRVMEKIQQVAATDTTVLIRGETGTGKELIARALHARSPRARQPLIAVNCGAISPGVVESELFGHEKGAFTGAIGRKLGRFELADGGTLFLDEIGDLSLELQVKLLRVLQEGELVRVGGHEPIRVDVRVIAATHRDLPAMVAQGQFRQDLYYRLNVFPILVPALRDRAEDIPLLVRRLTERYAVRLGKPIDTIPEAVVDRLSRFPWPGNIRELANVLERSVIVTTGTVLQLAEWVTGAHVPVTTPSAAGGTPARGLLDLEREHILTTLQSTGWRVSGRGGAAEVLGLKPTTLEARMKKLGITRPG